MTLHQSDGLSDIPETEKWDLVVANPPHFPRPVGRGVISDDPGWKLHRLFYENIAMHLLDGGSIVFQENYLQGRCLSRLVPVIRAPARGKISAGPFILSEGSYFLRDLEGEMDILMINVR